MSCSSSLHLYLIVLVKTFWLLCAVILKLYISFFLGLVVLSSIRWKSFSDSLEKQYNTSPQHAKWFEVSHPSKGAGWVRYQWSLLTVKSYTNSPVCCHVWRRNCYCCEMERRSSGTWWNFSPLNSSRALSEMENVKKKRKRRNWRRGKEGGRTDRSAVVGLHLLVLPKLWACGQTKRERKGRSGDVWERQPQHDVRLSSVQVMNTTHPPQDIK